MRHRFRYPVSALLLMLSAVPALADDDAYAIKLSRPDKVGEVFDIVATVDYTRNTTVTTPQRLPQVQTEVVKGEIQGRVEYLEVDKKGDATSLVLTVKKMVDADGKEILQPGQEVRIKRDAKTTTLTLASGGAVPDAAQKLLTQIYGPHNSDTPTDDQTFGSATPHKVGDSWPINAEMTAKALAASGMDIDPKQLSGTTTVKSAEVVAGLPALRIDCQLVTKDATPSSPDASLKVDSLNMQLNLAGAFPVDTALQPPELNEHMQMEMHLTGLTNDLSVMMKGNLIKTLKITPIKK